MSPHVTGTYRRYVRPPGLGPGLRVSANLSARDARTLATMSEIDPHGAGGLERSWRERAFADGNGDVASGRRRGLHTAVGDPARGDDSGLCASGSRAR